MKEKGINFMKKVKRVNPIVSIVAIGLFLYLDYMLISGFIENTTTDFMDLIKEVSLFIIVTFLIVSLPTLRIILHEEYLETKILFFSIQEIKYCNIMDIEEIILFIPTCIIRYELKGKSSILNFPWMMGYADFVTFVNKKKYDLKNKGEL